MKPVWYDEVWALAMGLCCQDTLFCMHCWMVYAHSVSLKKQMTKWELPKGVRNEWASTYVLGRRVETGAPWLRVSWALSAHFTLFGSILSPKVLLTKSKIYFSNDEGCSARSGADDH